MTLDKRTVVLGVAAAAAVAAAATATAINHTSTGSRQRRVVTDYINAVNAIQIRMHAPLARVMLAYRDFTSIHPTAHRPATELAAAAQTLSRLERRVAALPAPPEAKVLRARIVRLVAQEAVITGEVQRLADFTPRYSAILRRSSKASAELHVALAAVQIPQPHRLRGTKKQILAAQSQYQGAASAAAGAQADAVDGYDRAIAGVIVVLRGLRPPQALMPTYRAQVHALRDAVAAGSRLATELRKPNRTSVAVLGRKFTLASREASSVAAQRAQIAAIRAYNKRARAVTSAASDVQQELARLQRTLP